MTLRITPAVPSGRNVIERPPLSSKVYISLETTSVDSPTPRLNNSVSSKTGNSINWYPETLAALIKVSRTNSKYWERGGKYSLTPFGADSSRITLPVLVLIARNSPANMDWLFVRVQL